MRPDAVVNVAVEGQHRYRQQLCWGYTRDGAATPPAGSFVSVSAGGSHTCGVRIDGSVACWGSNYWGSDYYGQATPPAGSFSPTPRTADPTPEPTPTPTMAPTHTPTPVPTPAAMPLSLNEYLTHCAPTDLELADNATFGDLSSQLAAEADSLEALTPPAQLSEWHMLAIHLHPIGQVKKYPSNQVQTNLTARHVES